MPYQRRDWLFVIHVFLWIILAPNLWFFEKRDRHPRSTSGDCSSSTRTIPLKSVPCCIPCSRTLVNRLITIALSTPEARAQFQAYMAETVYNTADQFLPTCGEPTRRGEGSPEDDFNMPKQGDDWIWTPHWPPTVLLWREWAAPSSISRPGVAIRTFGRFPVGPVHFQMYFGPLGWEKITLTIILSSPKVNVLHSSDISLYI